MPIDGQITKANATSWEWKASGEFPMQWYPIETAPKDGRRVLLVEADMPSEVCVGWWIMDAWRDMGDMGCNGQIDYSPTHWMPLPFGPDATISAGQSK